MMDVKNSQHIGNVARTAAGLTHINRLRLPGFGVRELRLKTKDGTKQSASNTHKGQIAGTGGDFNFAPGRKSDNSPVDPVQIVYRIEDPFGVIQRAKLELFYRFEKAPFWTLELHPAQFAQGEHVIDWDGFLQSEIEFIGTDTTMGKYTHRLAGKPKTTKGFEDVLTAAYSPYRMKLSLGADQPGDPPTGWTDFHVLVHSIELELGWKDTLPLPIDSSMEELDKAVWDSLCGPNNTAEARKAALPAEGDTVPKRVFLISNLFKMNDNEMGDNTLFDQYNWLWKNGPSIPIFAHVWMKNSQGAQEQERGAAVGLSRVKFLWDYEDATEDTAAIAREPPRTYIERALDYDITTALPIGDNCHVDRGGKRMARPDLHDQDQRFKFHSLFPDQDGEDPAAGHKVGQFPFRVRPCRHAHRFWAATSEAWTTGTLQGMTGVMFKPSRMAGDTYRVVCYLAYDRDADGELLLDTDVMIDAAVKAATGPLQIWRKLHISKYLRKTPAIGDFFQEDAWQEVQEVYREAFIELEPAAGMITGFLDRDAYHKVAVEALKSYFHAANEDAETSDDKPDEEDGEDAEETGLDTETPQQSDLFTLYVGLHHQYEGTGTATNPSGNALTCNDWEQMQAAADNWFYARRRKKHPAEPDSASHTLATIASQKWVANTFANGVFDYAEYLSKMSEIVIDHIFRKLDVLSDAAEGIVIVEFAHMQNVITAFHEVMGIALDVKGHARNKCAYVSFGSAAPIMAHEIGHQMMCPHAPGQPPGGREAENTVPNWHDQDDRHCLMSYNVPVVTFCGKCQLRLRGWDGLALDKDGTKNSR